MRGATGRRAMVVAPLAVVALLGVFALGAAALANWRVYRDPLGLLTIRFPITWTVDVTMSGQGVGDGQSLAEGGEEYIAFGDPAQGRAGIEIVATQLNPVLAQQRYCGPQSPTQVNTTLNGYPAGGDAERSEWLLDSADAHFQIDIAIPGAAQQFTGDQHYHPSPPLPTPTPLPQTTVIADHAALSAALASFKPTAEPLACPPSR